jgi:hypothetical protein
MNGVTKPTPAIETRRWRRERLRRAKGDEVVDDTISVPQRAMFT